MDSAVTNEGGILVVDLFIVENAKGHIHLTIEEARQIERYTTIKRTRNLEHGPIGEPWIISPVMEVEGGSAYGVVSTREACCTCFLTWMQMQVQP